MPHNDIGVNDSRAVAFIWYLTRSWRQEWGGALFWCPTGQYIKPEFNVLIMFRVTPENMHFVCPVAAGATERRLTVNGFWHRSQPSSALARIPEDALVSPRAYGPQAPQAAALSPVIVL